MEKTVGSRHTCISSAFARNPINDPNTADGVTMPLTLPNETHHCLGHPRRLVARTRKRCTAVQERPAGTSYGRADLDLVRKRILLTT